VDHELSSITVGTERIAVQTFKPSQPRGTILISHGYLDHTGLWSHAIAHFLDKSYAVVAFDYPGHGLSTGQPADIDDFTTYRDVLDTVATRTRNRMASPVHLVGHSMGAGLIAEHILRSGLAPPRRAVLIAPNIRSNHWLLSRAGHTLASPFMNHVPRLNKAVSSNQAFLEFRANQDPLQAGRTPLRWFRELVEWQREMQTLPPHSADVRIIQGTADGVTDWTYNLPFLQKKLPGAHSVRLPGARHHLINETPPLRQRTLRLTTDYLRP
jgi:lysophospholipase